MTLPVWPATVPVEARTGWQMSEMYLAPISTEMDGGNQRLRRRPGDNVAIINYPLRPLSLTEWVAFDAFIRTTLSGGTSRFTMPLTIGGSTASKTVQLDGGKSPTVTQEGVLMYVTLPLRVYGM